MTLSLMAEGLLDNGGVLGIAGLEFEINWDRSKISGWGRAALYPST
jgi:hypothetical protein